MKHDKVLKKVEKRLGVKASYGSNGKIYVCYKDYCLSWWCEKNGEASLLHVRRQEDTPDARTDYFPGHFCENVSQMLDFVCPPSPKFPVGALVRGKDNKRAQRMGYAGKMGLVHGQSQYGRAACVYLGDNLTGTIIPERDLENVS